MFSRLGHGPEAQWIHLATQWRRANVRADRNRARSALAHVYGLSWCRWSTPRVMKTAQHPPSTAYLFPAFR